MGREPSDGPAPAPRIAEVFGFRVRLWRSGFVRLGVEALETSPAPGPVPVKAEAALRVATPLLKAPVADRHNWKLARLIGEIESREGVERAPGVVGHGRASGHRTEGRRGRFLRRRSDYECFGMISPQNPSCFGGPPGPLIVASINSRLELFLASEPPHLERPVTRRGAGAARLRLCPVVLTGEPMIIQ